jgi:membrane protein required for colicin V production
MDIIKTLGPLDYGFLAVLGISMLLGAAKGFIHVVMSLAGWFAALIAAHYLADLLSPYLTSTGLGDTSRYVLAFVIAFVIALIAWGIVTVMIKQAVSGIGLGGLDRLLGVAIGLVRGAVILISLTVLVSVTPADQSITWQNSIAVKMTKAAAQASKPFLPAKIAAIVPST